MSMTRSNFLFTAAAAPALATAPASVLASQTSEKPFQGTYRFTVGDATVTASLDGYLDAAPAIIPGFDETGIIAALEKYQKKLYPGGVRIPVNAFLVEVGGRRVLIDAGTSSFLGDTMGDLNKALRAINVSADSIDMVALTHIHPDHSGGLIDAKGQAVFANEQVAVGQAEYGFWHDDAIMAGVPESSRGFFQIARNTVAPYADRMIIHCKEQEMLPGLTSLPLPGHTPGHASYLLQSGKEQLLFWGDLVHMTALQFDNPNLTIAFDKDAAQTVDTPLNMFDRASADNLLVTGSHLDFPSLGKVRKSADGYS